jgi:hypothetical protein
MGIPVENIHQCSRTSGSRSAMALATGTFLRAGIVNDF